MHWKVRKVIVITLTNCPPSLRGDLTKWLFEIDTNVFVGRVNTRVRDLLWERIEQLCDTGRATMVFNTNNEQHFDFKVHNSEWEPTDIDGFKLMLRPTGTIIDRAPLKDGYSKASKYLVINQKNRIGIPKFDNGDVCAYYEEKSPLPYTIIHIETTGPSLEKNMIKRMSALHVSDSDVKDSISIVVRPNVSVPRIVTDSDYETNIALKEEEEELPLAIDKFLSFIGDKMIVGFDVKFCMRFVNAACVACEMKPLKNITNDVLTIAKDKLYNERNHSINRLTEYFGITTKTQAPGLDDCHTIMQIYEKLLKMDQ